MGSTTQSEGRLVQQPPGGKKLARQVSNAPSLTKVGDHTDDGVSTKLVPEWSWGGGGGSKGPL